MNLRTANRRNILKLLAVAVVQTALPASAFSAEASSTFLTDEGFPYAAFDELPHKVLKVPGAILQIGFAPGNLSVSVDRMLAWIEHSAHVVADYYGRFPVASARVLIVPVDGRGVRNGTTWGYRGAAIRLVVGQQSSEEELKQDWKIVHEMVHLALPDLSSRYSWLSEGLATYIEPVARVQAGDLTAESIWAAMLHDMHQGMPKSGDHGLDNTHTWASTYWGGALFCLTADIAIRKHSDNRLGLQDAMRGVIAAGGNHESAWPIGQIFSVADHAVGGSVLAGLYAQMGSVPSTLDLQELWRDLGIRSRDDGSVAFDAGAPLAKIRLAITAKPRR